MSIINKEVSNFKANAFHAGEFKTVSKDDILGKVVIHIKHGESLFLAIWNSLFNWRHV